MLSLLGSAGSGLRRLQGQAVAVLSESDALKRIGRHWLQRSWEHSSKSSFRAGTPESRSRSLGTKSKTLREAPVGHERLSSKDDD